MLEPNLSAGGLTFTGIAIFVFVTANIVSGRPPDRLEHELRCDKAWPLESPATRLLLLSVSPTCDAGECRDRPEDSGTTEGSARRTGAGATEARRQRKGAEADAVAVGHRCWLGVSPALRQVLIADIAILAKWPDPGDCVDRLLPFRNIHTGVAAASLYCCCLCGPNGGRIDHSRAGSPVGLGHGGLPASDGLGGPRWVGGGLIFYPLFLAPLGC